MGQKTSNLSLAERVFLRPLLVLHDQLYRRTDGRIGHHMPGMPPSLLLHTTGAKTGMARATTLTYARDGQDLLVAGSMGGAPAAPGWYHNLKKNPEVAINLGAKRVSVRAHAVLPEDPQYARLWRIVNEDNSNRYDGYQQRTTRPIPVVRLTPN